MNCEPIALVDASKLIAWIEGIPFTDWPQQHRLEDGKIRPAMVTDHAWHDFKAVTDPVVSQIMGQFKGCSEYQRMLSVVMPGHSIPPHVDHQAHGWVCRVHVPLVSNEQSQFIVSGTSCRLVPGLAYRVNTRAEHSVANDGATPRIHFMFDVKRD